MVMAFAGDSTITSVESGLFDVATGEADNEVAGATSWRARQTSDGVGLLMRGSGERKERLVFLVAADMMDVAKTRR